MSLFDFEKTPDHYAVMGNPIAHSKSPFIHAAFARQTRQNMVYDRILVEPGSLAQAIGNFQAHGGKGLNITVPFKRDAWRFADELSARAQTAGAVNTLKLREDGTWYGDNTDGVGLLRDLTVNHRIGIAGSRVLMLGAGGAARGALEPLLQAGPSELVIVNRTATRAVELAAEFSRFGVVRGCGYPELRGQQFDLIINATSASLHDELPPLEDGILALGGSGYDMMYAKDPTPFLRWLEGQGAGKRIDGLGMLVEQAAEAFSLWRGVRPETTTVIEAVRASL